MLQSPRNIVLTQAKFSMNPTLNQDQPYGANISRESGWAHLGWTHLTHLKHTCYKCVTVTCVDAFYFERMRFCPNACAVSNDACVKTCEMCVWILVNMRDAFRLNHWSVCLTAWHTEHSLRYRYTPQTSMLLIMWVMVQIHDCGYTAEARTF